MLTQGWGGIVVGLISKTAGSVRKGKSKSKVHLQVIRNPVDHFHVAMLHVIDYI